MNNVNKTLYIPLYGKSFVSKKGVILHDSKAEEIWEKEAFPLKGKAKSKWLAYYMGMRSAVFDNWLKEKMSALTDYTVLHLGCGMDSRIERLCYPACPWFDVDFEAVINERKKHFNETDYYRMLAADLIDETWLEKVPVTQNAIILLEGVCMYLDLAQLKGLLARLSARFPCVHILLDCYSPFAAKMSKIKNPINAVGVSKVYGIKSPTQLEENTGLTFLGEREMTPDYLIDELEKREKRVFKMLYAGKMAKSLYKLYEYES